jgi:hypothetical protein
MYFLLLLVTLFKVQERICGDRMNILFWDRDLIVGLCTTRRLPDSIQRDIRRYIGTETELANEKIGKKAEASHSFHG